MEHSTRKYFCGSCNLQFKDYKQCLSHKYLLHDEDLRSIISKDDGGSQNYSNDFKTACERNTGKSSVREELTINKWMESSGDVFKHHFDYSDQRSTQFHHDTLTENTAMPSSSQLSGYKQEPLNRYHLTPESDAKELPLSLKPDQKEICRLDRNCQTNRSQPLMSTECNPIEIYTYGMNEQFNRNLSTSEYSQMQYFGHGNIEQMSIKQSLPSSGLKEMIGTNPQFNGYPLAESLEYIPLQLSTCVKNQYLNKNQLNVSHECSEMEVGEPGMNSQSSTNQRPSTDVHDCSSMLKEEFSSQNWEGNKSEFNLQQISKKYPREFDSADTSIAHYIDEACEDQIEVNVSHVTENEFEAHDKTSASNSSLKENYVPFAKTLEKCESSASSLNNRMNPLRYHYYSKKTSRYRGIENKLGGNLNANRLRRSDIGKDAIDCHGIKNRFNQKSRVLKSRAIHTAEKPCSCEVCKKTFSNEFSLRRHCLNHTGEKSNKCDVSKKEFSRKTHLKAHYRIHTGEKPYKCDVCSKVFNQKVTLDRHYRIHTGEKPYMCDACGIKFNVKCNLKTHYRIHTVVKGDVN